jgi:hypothetical protein
MAMAWQFGMAGGVAALRPASWSDGLAGGSVVDACSEGRRAVEDFGLLHLDDLPSYFVFIVSLCYGVG